MNKILVMLLSAVALLGLSAPSSAAISGTWKIYPTFDNSVTHLADAPDRVYFTGYVQSVISTIDFRTVGENALFCYDKESDEIRGLSKSTGLSSTAIRDIVYNGYSGYLLIIYNDYDIDLLMDSGEVRNISALKTASIPGSKAVNGICFYPKAHQVVLATDFGYIILDDEKGEVAESRNYNYKIDAAARFGDRMLLSYDGATYVAPYSDRRMQLSDYTRFAAAPKISEFVEMGDTDETLLAIEGGGSAHVYVLSSPGPSMRVHTTYNVGSHQGVSRSKDGTVLVSLWGAVRYLDNNLSLKGFVRPESDYSLPYSSWDGKEYYVGYPRKGLRRYKVDYDANSMTVTKDYALPNAPNPYWSRAMLYHPRYGMLVNNYGDDSCFGGTTMQDPMLMCAYRQGLWTPLSNAYLNTPYLMAGYNPMGLIMDPDDDRYVYTTSEYSGILRTNLEDPTDILHMSHPADPTSNLPGYVKIHDDFSWKRLCCFAPISLDHQGNMWSLLFNWNGEFQFWYWTPEARRASKTASSFRPWKQISVPAFTTGNDVMLALKSPNNRGLLVVASASTGFPIYIYDTNNTPDDTTDDSYKIMTGITDQDGGTVNMYRTCFIYEDEQSGAVWLGAQSGLYHFQPRQALGGQNVLNRVKVARNDGTSLADYLLNGIMTTHMTSDNLGRKWISTQGAGLVVTSSDCRTVLAEFTSNNSDLPSDDIYFSQYNPDNNSMMISTGKGIVEFALSGGGSSSGDASSVRAYPNPVAPDYYGWVNIDGLPDNAHVKIVDSEGNLVRELGLAEGGSAQWDVNNIYGNRVRTGVYYILTSGASGDSNVAKILVMN